MSGPRPRLARVALGTGCVAALVAVWLLPSLAHAAPSEFEAARAEGWLGAFLSVFGAGVLTSLTPCVYPMIPIVMGIFGARGEDVSRGRAFLLATSYVVGMGVMYSALGVGVALAGSKFGAFLSNPWVVWPLVAFYAVLAASMFGAFELNLPSGLQQRLSRVGGKGYAGAFGMGMVGGLTAAPCTGPMLLGILGFVAQTGNVPLGFSLLFTYAIGMGVLFWVLALAAVALPKSGAWMEAVKSIAGLALLVMGVYFLRPVVPALEHLVTHDWPYVIVGAGAIVLGGLLGAIHLSFHGPRREKVRKAAGVAFAFLGAATILFVFLAPELTPGWRVPCAAAATLPEHKETCFGDDEAILAEAKAAGQPVLIDFGASWCAPCKKYETVVFADAAVFAELQAGFVSIKFDVSEDTDENLALQKRYDAESLPTVILLGPDGREVRRFHEPIPTPEEFLAALKAARAGGTSTSAPATATP